MEHVLGQWIRPDEGARLDECRMQLMRRASEQARLVLDGVEEIAFADDESVRTAAQAMDRAALKLQRLANYARELADAIEKADADGDSKHGLKITGIGGGE